MQDLENSNEFIVRSVLSCAWDVMMKKPMLFYGMALITKTIYYWCISFNFGYRMSGLRFNYEVTLLILLFSLVSAIYLCTVNEDAFLVFAISREPPRYEACEVA